MRRRLARFIALNDSMLCIPFPRLARFVVVARLESGAFYVLDNVVFIWHRNALRWIEHESKALQSSRYEVRRISYDGEAATDER